MEEKNIYNSDNEMVISVGDFVAELSCVFDNIFYTINAETGALETLSTKCAIFDKLGQIKFKYFTDEEKAQIDKYTSPDNIFILVYDEHDPSHYAVTCLTVKELTSAIQNAYLEGKFAKQDVYKLLKDAQNSVCSKSGSGKYILKNLFSDGNCIVYREDIPVLVTSDTEDSFFYINKAISSESKAVISMDFSARDKYSSVYEDPTQKLYPFLKNGIRDRILKEEELNDNRADYKILVNHKDLDKEIVFSLSMNRDMTFEITKVDIVDDYKGTVSIIHENYNDRNAIMEKLLYYNVDSHSDDLFNLID